ncbi:unnamed protein product [Meloidogyne enterolobii]|uniref:Uncharacterized protein n=1 Tax=Meloidogyne enterolobii TaxID=390850 RepID=A0ACB0YVY5_MELEN
MLVTNSFALKPGEDLDVELKKAKLEYFRIQGKLLAMEYEEKMEKKREEERKKEEERMKPRVYF